MTVVGGGLNVSKSNAGLPGHWGPESSVGDGGSGLGDHSVGSHSVDGERQGGGRKGELDQDRTSLHKDSFKVGDRV